MLVPKYHILDEIFFLFYCQDEDHSRVIKAQELPDFSNVFQPELPHCHTESEPFSFDQRDKELKKKKEEAVKAIILEEEKKVWSLSTENIPTIFKTNHMTWICTLKIYLYENTIKFQNYAQDLFFFL